MNPRERLKQAAEAWRSLAPRERLLVGSAALAVALLAVWLLALRPALGTLRQAPQQLDALDRQLQTMQRLAGEARELRAAPAISAAQAKAALEAASSRLGAKARLVMQGERAVLNVTDLGGEALRGWLQEVRAGARARPIEATLTRTAQGYTGSIVLVLGVAG
jgi:general secretion pathway protein M